MEEFSLDEEEFECSELEVDARARLRCRRILYGVNEISKDECRKLCPVRPPQCRHIEFALRRESVFSAIDIGGRRIEITLVDAACKLHKRKIDPKKDCTDCKDKLTQEDKLSDQQLYEKAKAILIKHLGENLTQRFFSTYLK